MIAYRCHTGGSHAIAIVGYDNNVECDVNDNGTIEACEKGAFKIVNSWGKQFNSYGISSTDGFYWVMYDALNKTSANTYVNWEESLPGTRCTAFRDSNTGYVMVVEEKQVNFVGAYNINTSNKYNLVLYKNSGTIQAFPFKDKSSNNMSYEGTLVFDYEFYPISSYIHGTPVQARYYDSSSSSTIIFSVIVIWEI